MFRVKLLQAKPRKIITKKINVREKKTFEILILIANRCCSCCCYYYNNYYCKRKEANRINSLDLFI